MPDPYFNLVVRAEIRDGVANARCVVPGQVDEVTAVDARRVVTFSPGIGELRAGEPVGDGPCPGRPVLYPGGGGWSVTWPLDAGDQALGLAVDRNPERWEANGVVGQAHTLDRPHDVSSVHVLPVTMDAADPGTDYVIRNDRGEVMRLGLGQLVISTPGDDPSRVATIEIDGTGSITMTVPTGRTVSIGDDLAVALTKWAALDAAITALLVAGSAAGTGAPGTTGKLAFDAAKLAYDGATATGSPECTKALGT